MAVSAPPARPRWWSLLAGAAEEWRTTPFYRMMLNGADPDRLTRWGTDPRRGDQARGRDIIRGIWRIGAERLAGEHPLPWSLVHPSPHFTARLHSFGWLADLAAVGPTSRETAARLVESWVIEFGEWHPRAWAPELTAERLFAWLCHGRAAFEHGDPAVRPMLMRSFGCQARHLRMAAKDIRDPLARLKAGAALTIAGASGAPEGDRLLDEGVEILIEACASQFLSDGGHRSRNPEALMEALGDLIAADDALARAGLETEEIIRAILPKAADMVRFFRLSDGRLACFNGGGEGQTQVLAAVMQAAGGEGRNFNYAPQSGYQRLAAGDTVVVMDVAGGPPLRFGERAHAGALAFELSHGADRVICNVGSAFDLDAAWRAAGRATNGHSTLIVADALSARFEQVRGQRGAARPAGPVVSAKRFEDDEGAHIEASHDGYRAEFGYAHRRILSLDPTGRRVSGMDALEPPPRASGRAAKRAPFSIRFHLHTDVQYR